MKLCDFESDYEIPNNWVWCNLGLLFNHNTGKALNSANSEGKALTYITTSNVYWNRFELNDLKSMPFTDSEIEKCTIKKGDLLVCEGGDIGRAAIWNFDNEIRIQNHLHRLRAYDYIQTAFYYYVLYAFKLSGKISGNGIGLQGLSSNALHNIIVPVPPIEEQKNIVMSIEKLMLSIDNIESHKNILAICIENTKAKILELAIRGKLVPQDPNDEPASVLLERIRAEKEELIKQGKIKRDKKESVIFKGDDNSYYQDLPSNWINIRLSAISEIITKGTTPRGGKIAYRQSGIGFLRAENIAGYDKLDLSNLNYVDEESHKNYLKRSILKENDILITIAGTLGRTAIVPQHALPLNSNQAVAIVRLVNNKLINVKYLAYTLNSPIIKSDLLAKSVDMAIPNLSLDNIAECNISLPPLAEQKRIVEAIEKIFATLDDIANQVE
ncbi:restriction endonuclease subunit S [Eshraghiella crossota]|nr:restriction endonuclease subunit S [Butyrivibrio crossotus]UWO50145.1 restriction endonuclease subunit S [Butyrivibrio crossotus]